MKGFLSNPDSEPYDNWSQKKHLKEHFRESIYFSEGEDLRDVITMTEKKSQILRPYILTEVSGRYRRVPKRAIIETAVIKTADWLIKSDIMSQIPT